MLARTAFRTLQPLRCQARRYTTVNEPIPPPPTPNAPKSGTNAVTYILAAAGIGGAAYYYYAGTPAGKNVAAVSTKKALTGGDQGFIPLKLEHVDEVNHNTKKFRFKLPEDEMVSGLEIASAILTKYKPEGAEKAILRPYTPISDEGTLSVISTKHSPDSYVTNSPQTPRATWISSSSSTRAAL